MSLNEKIKGLKKWKEEVCNKEFDELVDNLEEDVKEAVEKLKEIDFIEIAEDKIAKKESFNVNHLIKKEIDKIFGEFK